MGTMKVGRAVSQPWRAFYQISIGFGVLGICLNVFAVSLAVVTGDGYPLRYGLPGLGLSVGSAAFSAYQLSRSR